MRTYPLLLCALIALPTLARAQDGAPDSAPPQAENAVAGAKNVAIAKGEIRLDGRITAMTGERGFDIKAFSFTTQAGKVIEFDEAKDKSIEGAETTKVYAGDDLEKPLGWNVVKLGMRVGVIGRDTGSGKPLKVRALVLSDFSSKYVAGRSISVSAPVSAVLRRGVQAFEGGDFERALTLFREAASTGAGLGDQSGVSLALSRQGGAYSELGQDAKAIEAYQQALKIREGIGDAAAAGGIQNNLAMILLRAGRAPEAVTLLQKANDNNEGETEEVQLLKKSNLGRAYLANKQWESAAEIFRGLIGRYKTAAQPEREVGAMLSIARAMKELGKDEDSATSLAQARARIDTIEDAPKKAASLMVLGGFLAGNKDKDGARAAINSAIEIFGAQGDSRSAERARVELARLDAPDTAPADAAGATSGGALADAPAPPVATPAPAAAPAAAPRGGARQ